MDKFAKIKKLTDAMYYAAQHLTTDASRLHKAMEEYHQFVINEYHNEEPASEAFASLINGTSHKKIWEENPWVWVYEFVVI